MAIYVQKPQRVDAHQIIGVEVDKDNGVVTSVKLETGEVKETPWSMVREYQPQVGDFFLTRPDGFQQVKPKGDFLDRYAREETDAAAQ